MKRLMGRSMWIWAAMIPLAIANGALREYLLLPWMGSAARPVSGVILCALFYGTASALLPRLGAGTRRAYRRMGLLWAGCTVLFETMLGLLGGDSLTVILNNYNPLTGDLWLLVVIFMGFTPWLAAKRKKLI